MRDKILLGVSLFLYLAAVQSLYFVAGLPAGNRGSVYIAVHVFLTALWLGVWKLSLRDKSFPLWVLTAGILARVLLLRVPSFTSHDVFRYLWDGFIFYQGSYPYTVSPEKFLTLQSVGEFRSIWPDNSTYPTIYPPLSVILFSFCARFGPEAGVGLWKIIVTCASLLTLLLSWHWLRKKDSLSLLAVPALFPLLILESGVGAHVDVLVGLALLAAFLVSDKKRDLMAGIFLGLATLLKLYPLCLFPLFLVERDKKRAAWFLGGGFATIGLAYLGMTVGGYHLSGSLSAFLKHWSFGSPMGALFHFLLPENLARFTLLVGFLGAYVILLFERRRTSLTVQAEVTKGLSLLWFYSPVVFPWYLVPLVVVSSLKPSSFIFLWASLLPFTYEVVDRFDLGLGWLPAVWPLVLIVTGWVGVGWWYQRARR